MSKWKKVIKHNSWMQVFKKYLLKVIKTINQKELVRDLFNTELEINDLIIKEASKPIIDIYNFQNKRNSIIKEKNIKVSKKKLLVERKIEILTFCLLQFKGLIRYLHYHGVGKEDIKKMSNYITYKKVKKGKYIFRNNERSDALYGLIKGKIELRRLDSFDYTNKFKIELMRDNFSSIDFENNIPFENFMSDCEDDGKNESENEEEKEEKEEEEEEEEYNNKYNNYNNKYNNKYNNYYNNYTHQNNKDENELNESFKFINEEDLDYQIDKKIYLERKKEIDLSIKYKEEKEKKNEIINIIKAIKKHQTPKTPFSKETLDKFIREFEYIENILCQGECFGELNLLNKNFLNSPIYCIEDSDFFILEREFFNKILLKSFIKSHKNKIRFIADKFPLFKNEMKTSNLLNQVIPKYFEKETLIYSPFDKAEYLYLVYQGECNLISVDNAKNKEDYMIKTNKRKIISKILIGGIAGFESCLNGINNYENALIVSKEYSVLFKINVNYISQIYKGFKKSILPLYQEQKKIFMDLNKKNIKIKLNLWLKQKDYEMKLKNNKDKNQNKKFLFNKNKHIHRSCLSGDGIIFNNLNLQKKICNINNTENNKLQKRNIIKTNFIFKSLSKEKLAKNIKNQKKDLFKNYCLTIKNSMYNIYSNTVKKFCDKDFSSLNSISLYNSSSSKTRFTNSNDNLLNKRKALFNKILTNYKTGKFELPFVTQIINSD